MVSLPRSHYHSLSINLLFLRTLGHHPGILSHFHPLAGAPSVIDRILNRNMYTLQRIRRDSTGTY